MSGGASSATVSSCRSLEARCSGAVLSLEAPQLASRMAPAQHSARRKEEDRMLPPVNECDSFVSARSRIGVLRFVACELRERCVEQAVKPRPRDAESPCRRALASTAQLEHPPCRRLGGLGER